MTREWHARDEAWQRARSFARRFGEPHVRLAMHGAVPIGLTPELLHLIRVNFVAATPWVAEADLLLSPMCRDVGGGFFEMDEELRGLLVEELQRDPDFGPARLQAVADFLGAWADRVRDSATDPEWSDFVEGQALTALSYRKPEEAAQALARSLNNSSQHGRAGIDARVIKLTQGLSTALMSQVEIVTYAVALDKLAAGDVDAALDHFSALGPIDQAVKIGNVDLPAPMEWGMAAEQENDAGTVSEAETNTAPNTAEVELVGECKAIQEVRETIGRIAPSVRTVFILGETGTGKNLVARLIHQASTRSLKPFLTVDCAALSEAEWDEQFFGGSGPDSPASKIGLFESASGGTLFLDEITELPEVTRPKLLAVLGTREFSRPDGSVARINCRLLAATRRNLEEPPAESGFLQELYRRLNVATIVMPPLRERGEDIIILAERFASEFSRRSQLPIRRIPREVRQRLLHYPWPGNVRELQNVIERLVILGSGDEIAFNDLPPEIKNSAGANGRVVLTYSSGVEANQSVAAKIADSLNSEEYEVFEAPQDLRGDAVIARMILSRIRESRAVIVVYGAESANSEWIKRLSEFSIEENVTLIPILVGPLSTPWLHQTLGRLNHLFWNDADPESSLRSLRAALEQPRQPVAPRPDLPKMYVSCVPEDRQLGLRICEHLKERGHIALLDEPHGPPPGQWGASLESLLNQGNLLILILSEYDSRNIWLQKLSGLTMPFRSQILPIRAVKPGTASQTPEWLKRFPWFDEWTRTVPEILAKIDRFIAASAPSSETADDLYIETAAARDAKQSILSGASLIVSAPRRSGKTAFLRYLQRSLEEQGIAVRYVGPDQKYDLATNAVLLLDDVHNLKHTVEHLSLSHRRNQTVLATPASSGYMRGLIVELEEFTRGLIVELQDFTLRETEELNRRSGFPLRPDQLKVLFDFLDGHPFLTRAAIAAADQRQLVNVADVHNLQPVEEELHLLDHELGAGDLRRAWAGLLSGSRLDVQAQDRLLALGLAKKRDGQLVPRNRLYREYFARPRRDLHTVLISTPDRDLPCARAVRIWLENHNTTVIEFDDFGGTRELHDPQVEQALDRADVVVGLIAEPYGGRGNLAEIEMAFERFRSDGRPKIFAVLVERGAPPSELLSEMDYFNWDSDADTPALLRKLAALIGEDGPSPSEESLPE